MVAELGVSVEGAAASVPIVLANKSDATSTAVSITKAVGIWNN